MQKKKNAGAKTSRSRTGFLKGDRVPTRQEVCGATTLSSKTPRAIKAHPHRVTAGWVDPDDAPELTAEHFERADLYHGDKLVRAGRPRSANPKLALKLRIDPDIVEYFRATGPGWQTRINDTLRKAAKLAMPRRFSAR